MYTPLNFEQLNAISGRVTPSSVHPANNAAFTFWCRAFYQRACSTIILTVPDEWEGPARDLFYYSLFMHGFSAIFKHPAYGYVNQPCTLSGVGFYYQPTDAMITSPFMSEKRVIGEDCEIVKLAPDYMGVWDTISYYAEKAALLDSSIDMSLINSKIAYVLGAKNKAAAEALKLIMDKVNSGQPTVIFDKKILDDPTSKESPFQSWTRDNLKQSYITTDLLMDLNTIISNFDAEVGIPSVPYQKKERMVTSEAESRTIDAVSRSTVWYETLKSSIARVKKLYPDIKLDVTLRYKNDEEVSDDDENDTDRSV